MEDDDSSNSSDHRLGSQIVSSTVPDTREGRGLMPAPYNLGGQASMMQDDSDMPDIMAETMPDSPTDMGIFCIYIVYLVNQLTVDFSYGDMTLVYSVMCTCPSVINIQSVQFVEDLHSFLRKQCFGKL